MDAEVSTAQTERANERSEELVYAAAVLILSEDLYPRKLEVVREYIQNASDALDEYMSVADQIEDRAEPVIKISLQGRSLLIYDNGIGMDEEEITKLKRIAYSEKKAGEEAGYKGIGRLAGVAIADKLKISSTSYGDSKLHHFEFRAKEMRQEISENKKKGIQEPASQAINRHSSIWWTDIDPDDHYTMVELRDIKESCGELFDAAQLIEYIGDIGPVDFAPATEFDHGPAISDKLRQNVPDYSPKTIYLSTASGERVRIYKPYSNEMSIAEPDFIKITNPDNPAELLAYCWYASKGKEMLGRMRPSGKIFSVGGTSEGEKRRFAGMAYKLFGFSIGDRTLPQRTLWTTALPRAIWFTGEIHIIDKAVTPTTDRSHFVENDARQRLFSEARRRIPTELNNVAQKISDARRAHDDSAKIKKELDGIKTKLDNRQIDRADIKTIKGDLRERLEQLKDREKKCKDTDITNFVKEVAKQGRGLDTALDDPKLLQRMKTVADIASELNMTSKARKVFEIIMETLARNFVDDKAQYYSIAEQIYKALRKRY